MFPHPIHKLIAVTINDSTETYHGVNSISDERFYNAVIVPTIRKTSPFSPKFILKLIEIIPKAILLTADTDSERLKISRSDPLD